MCLEKISLDPFDRAINDLEADPNFIPRIAKRIRTTIRKECPELTDDELITLLHRVADAFRQESPVDDEDETEIA